MSNIIKSFNQDDIDIYFPTYQPLDLHLLKGDDPRFIEEEKKAERVRKIGRFKQSNFPEKYYGVNLEDLDVQQKNIANPFLAKIRGNNITSLWLCGKAGTGKTCLASAICKEACFLGKSVTYIKSHIITEKLKKNQISIDSLIYELKQNDIVVIDEVGRYPLSEWESYYLFLIMDELYNKGISVIMISNLEKNKLGELLGAACVDRFKGIAHSFEFNNESYRGTKEELYV